LIRTSSKHAYNLLENLLQWARSQTGDISLNHQIISIKDPISDTISLVSGNAYNKNISIETDLVKDDFVYADIFMVSTILRNLLTNAIKFTNKNGKIIVSAKKKKGFLEISISDTGVGIAPMNLEKVFKIDFKLSSLGTNKEKGTGLGLILCKEFVEKQGGMIWVESELGKGSVFTFTLAATK
jgi:two-component system sensor histidine kinase/response regulator